MERISWDDYFLEVVDSISKRATCDRGRSGCVIVSQDNQIISTGYVGSPKGLPHCDEIGHLYKEFRGISFINNEKIEHEASIHCVRTIHAEMNAILQAAKKGISVNGAKLYCTMTPCINCAMAIINVGIKDIYCKRKYHVSKESEEMFQQVGIKINYKYNEIENYSNQ